MAAINHGGIFYRFDKSSQSGDCGEANVMSWHHASKQVMPFAFAVKGIPFGKASLKLKRKANFIRAGSFSPLPLLPSSRNGLTASLLLIPLTPYLGELDQNMVVEYKLHREKSGAKPSTLKKELRVLKDILKLRSKEFELPTTKEFPLMQWGNKPKEFDKSMILEESDVLRITDHAQAKYRSICLIAIYSSLRLADIVSLCPKEVDLKEGWIRKYQGKTRHWVEIPVCQKLKDVLSLLIWPIEKNQSFFHVAKTRAISTEILKACKRAGYQGHSFKSFRHFAATFLVNAGVPIEIIKDFMGHRNQDNLDLCEG